MSSKYYISKIEYIKETRLLEIEWTIDVVWMFFDVPEKVYVDLLSASDKENYYRENVMNIFKGRQKWRNLDELLKISADILLIDDLSKGVNSTNACNESAIHLAASWGDVKAIELLVTQRAAIDEPGDCDCTPLYNAVMNSNKEAVALLLKLGAAPQSKNDLGYNPYELAVHKQNQEIIKEFLPYVQSQA